MKLKKIFINSSFFVLGFVACLFWVSATKGFEHQTNFYTITEIKLNNSTIIPKGSHIAKVKNMPEGYGIYAIYFKYWLGLESKLIQKDSEMGHILKSYWIDETKTEVE